MKKFMAMFLGSERAKKDWDALDEKARKEREQKGVAAWGTWVEQHNGAIVDTGSPLGKTLQVNKQGVSGTKNEVAAYVVVKAESHEEAAKLFLGHPHFSVFPGDRVEVMEFVPIPGSAG